MDWEGRRRSKNLLDWTQPGFGADGTWFKDLELQQKRAELYRFAETRDFMRRGIYAQADQGTPAAVRAFSDERRPFGAPNHRLRPETARELGRQRAARTGRSVDDMASEGVIVRDE